MSFPVKMPKNVKIEKKCQMTEYIEIALSDLVIMFPPLLETLKENMRNRLDVRVRIFWNKSDFLSYFFLLFVFVSHL